MTKDCIEVSFVISVYGQLEHTKRCLLELKKTLISEISYEVLIVDDASKDGTPKFLRTLDSRYRTFYNETNKGFAQNNNFAANQANGKYLCFLNNDVFVQGNWLLPMLEVFKTNDKYGFEVIILANDKNYYKFQWIVEKYYNDGALKDCWLTTMVSAPMPLGSSI